MNEKLLIDKAYQWILEFGPRIVLALIIFFVGLWIIRMVKKWLHKSFTKRNIDSEFRPFFASLIATVLQILLLIAIMQVLGIRMTIFAALIGAIGVAAGLALSGTMQNFTSGILILVLKPFEIGDMIVAQGQTGTVNSIQVFYTVVITDDNRTVIFPNSKLSNEVIINLSREGRRRVDIDLKFGYTHNLAEIAPVIQQAMLASGVVLQDPIPKVEIATVEQDGFHIKMNGWVTAKEYDASKSWLQQTIIEHLKNSGLKLPGMP
jgi:small conductance mechanosensitive channel